MAPDPLHPDDRGIACPAGGFWVDPWKPVETAVITHAHADHARPGMGRYVASESCVPLLRARIGKNSPVHPLAWGEPLDLGTTRVTLHPAGHIRGAAQVRVETTHKGRDHVAVAAGDYKRAADPTAEAFEPVPCDTFITEATFALPVYRWEPPSVVRVQIADWIDQNRATGRVSLILCYALGKAQRLLAELLAEHEARGLPPPTVWTHGAVEPLIELYRKTGVDMLPTRRVKESDKARGKVNPFAGEIVMAPPSAAGSPWVRRLGPARLVDTAFVSGWMRIRGVRRRRGYDRGFVLSDHADWPDLIRTCRETGASRVLCTHGSSETLARHLREQGLDAAALETAYEPEPEE